MAIRPLILALFAAAGCACAAEDVVLLVNGQRLVGTLDGTADQKQGTVAIRTSNGLLRIRSELVARVEESYATRRAKVRDDDAAGLLALAKWCLTKGMKTEALELLTLAVAAADVPIEARGLNATLVDELSGPEKALPLYQAYRAARGSDPAILARLKELEDVDRAARGEANDPVPAAAVPAVADGMEAKGWDAESPQWSNAVEAKVVTLTTEAGRNQVVELDFTGGGKDKMAVKRPLRGISLGENGELAMYACNRSKDPLRLAVALKTGNYVFHESQTLTVPADEKWHEVRVNLRSKEWKSEASQWAYNAEVANLDDLKEMQILVYNGKSDGVLLLDGIDFVKGLER
jgi:hypothetical protein